MTPELYGKCRELGYCDCGGFFGCLDPDKPQAVEGEALGRVSTQTHDRHRPYGKCPKCGRNLYASVKDHSCKVEAKPLFCDDCKAEYQGKPSDHLKEVHGRVMETEPAGWREQSRAILVTPEGKERSIAAEVVDGDPDCHFCMRWGKPCVRHGGAGFKANARQSDVPARMTDARGFKQPKCEACGLKAQRNHRCKAVIDEKPAEPVLQLTPEPIQAAPESIQPAAESIQEPPVVLPEEIKPVMIERKNNGRVDITIEIGSVKMTLAISEVSK